VLFIAFVVAPPELNAAVVVPHPPQFYLLIFKLVVVAYAVPDHISVVLTTTDDPVYPANDSASDVVPHPDILPLA